MELIGVGDEADAQRIVCLSEHFNRKYTEIRSVMFPPLHCLASSLAVLAPCLLSSF